MKKRLIKLHHLICIILIASVIMSCDNKEQYKDKMIGVKIYKNKAKPELLIEEWKKIGINTAFVSKSMYMNADFRKLARENEIKCFIITPIFYNEEALRKDPDLIAHTDKGKKAMDSWVHFICPTKDEYLTERIAYIKDIVGDLNPDGISLDFIRYFVFWERVLADRALADIDNSCFDETCISAFEKYAGIDVPDDLDTMSKTATWILTNHSNQWINFKCEVITNVVARIVNEVKTEKPELLFNLHGVPWRENDFDGAIKKIVGQDYKALSSIVDYISPMCYSFMLEREPAWINSVTADIKRQSSVPVVPSIQVNGYVYRDDELSIKEFKQCVIESLKEPSDGVVFWSWKMLKSYPEKMKAIQKVVK